MSLSDLVRSIGDSVFCRSTTCRKARARFSAREAENKNGRGITRKARRTDKRTEQVRRTGRFPCISGMSDASKQIKKEKEEMSLFHCHLLPHFAVSNHCYIISCCGGCFHWVKTEASLMCNTLNKSTDTDLPEDATTAKGPKETISTLLRNKNNS